MDTREWDAVVIGGGVAGLSAAQMLGRARRRTLVLDGGAPRNRFAAHMHGVLGHDGVDPADLLTRGRAESARYGAVVETAEVASVTDGGDEGGLRVLRRDGTVERTRAVVVATGIRDVLPPVDGLAPLWGTAVLHCPYCHGWEVADRRLGVLATSAASIHQIELVRQWSSDVTAFTALAGPLAPDVSARLIARGIRVVEAPVRRADVEGDRLVGLVDVTGVSHLVDAVFVAPVPEIPLDFLSALALSRSDQPGAPLTVDATGATSHPRVWAAGNVTAPFANVPLSMGAGSMAGAAVNAALVADDAARAVAARRAARAVRWEERYASADRVWSGRVNATVADVVRGLPVGSAGAAREGTALEIGCGEGADAAWLAEQGWRVTATDLSVTAIARATAAARARGLDEDRVRFVAGDAGDATPAGSYDLVTASFLHSWEPDFPRIGLLRRAAEQVAPGGWLLVVSHAAPPPWSRGGSDGHASPDGHEPPDGHEGHGERAGHDGPGDAPVLLTPAEELALLDLDPSEWTTEIVEVRRRPAMSPEGIPTHLDDGVLLLRRA